MCLYGTVLYVNCIWHSLCSIKSEVSNRQEDVMGYLIDMLYLMRELLKLAFMVMISPLGLAASYFISWE